MKLQRYMILIAELALATYTEVVLAYYTFVDNLQSCNWMKNQPDRAC